MHKINLTQEERKQIVTSLKKIMGQVQSVIEIVEHDHVADQTLVQLLAIKGGASRVCKDIISSGILKNLDKYSFEELDSALATILKIDS